MLIIWVLHWWQQQKGERERENEHYSLSQPSYFKVSEQRNGEEALGTEEERSLESTGPGHQQCLEGGRLRCLQSC